jgi:preprotein translocase subunit SecY
MNWKLIRKSLGHEDMRKRLLGVGAIIIIFRILAQVPIPLSDPTTLKQLLENLFNASSGSDFLGFLNVLSGGALANFSIMLLGLGPYINASIIMQLLTKAIPKLDNINKDGEYGRKKISQYTRIIALPLACVQAVGSIFLVRQTAGSVSGISDIMKNASLFNWGLMILAIAGGSMLLMWLGELVTEKGIGNGISLLITVGIVSGLPGLFGGIFRGIFSDSSGQKINLLGKSLPVDYSNLIGASILLVATIFIMWAVVKLNEATRNITIHYAKRVQGSQEYGGVTTILPLKLISAGVVPIIFALAFLTVPQFIGQILSTNSSAQLKSIGTQLLSWFQQPSATTFATIEFRDFLYPVAYFLLVIAFTFIYTNLTFDTKELSENLQKQGGFIDGVRSGQDTASYLGKVVNRLSLFGAISIGLIALSPIIAQIFLKTNISVGGTSVLILVSVSLETLRQLESRALMVTYDDYSRPDFVYGSTSDEAQATKKRRKLSLRRK